MSNGRKPRRAKASFFIFPLTNNHLDNWRNKSKVNLRIIRTSLSQIHKSVLDQKSHQRPESEFSSIISTSTHLWLNDVKNAALVSSYYFTTPRDIKTLSTETVRLHLLAAKQSLVLD